MVKLIITESADEPPLFRRIKNVLVDVALFCFGSGDGIPDGRIHARYNIATTTFGFRPIRHSGQSSPIRNCWSNKN